MALNRYVLTASISLPSGAFTENLYAASGTPVNGTGSYAQGAGSYGSAPGQNWQKGMVIWADPAGPLFTAIGAGNLRAFVDGQDTVGHAALGN